MATIAGKEGVVYIGANQIAEVNDWEIQEEAATIDDNELSDDWETHLVGRKRWTGNVSCAWDPSDSDGQGALAVGASVTLNLYPEGNSSGDTYYTGTATVTRITRNTAIDQKVNAAFEFTGNGELSETTVSA